MVLLISYDLRQPRRDYTPLREAIKEVGSWAHPLESLWLLETTLSASSVAVHLRQYLDPNDGLLVLGVTTDWEAFGLSDEVTRWLNKRLP